jgi:hypothetical protein
MILRSTLAPALVRLGGKAEGTSLRRRGTRESRLPTKVSSFTCAFLAFKLFPSN